MATEDELSEAVAGRLIEDAGAQCDAAYFVGRKGNTYLKNKMSDFMKIAHRPVLILTDLDSSGCAPELRKQWLGSRANSGGVVFRIAVREVESWLLADRKGFAKWSGISIGKMLRDIEKEADPKRYLLGLARSARKDIRDELLPNARAAASQGFGYNRQLGGFARTLWSLDRAAEASDSLRRARMRIRECQLAFQQSSGHRV